MSEGPRVNVWRLGSMRGEQNPDTPDNFEKRKEALSKYGFWKYAKSRSYIPENEKEEFESTQKVLASLEGFEVVKQIHREIKSGKFYQHEFDDSLRNPVVREHLSPEVLRGILSLHVACAGKNNYILEDVAKGYLQSTDFRENFSAQKLEAAAQSLALISRSLKKISVYSARPTFVQFARAAGSDFSPESTAQLCRVVESLEKKHSMSDDTHRLISSFFSAGIFPKQRPLSELEGFVSEIINTAQKVRTEHRQYHRADLGTLAHLVHVPNIGDNFSNETAKKIFEQVSGKVKESEMDYGTTNAVFSNALPALIRSTDTSKLNLDNWTGVVDKAKQLSDVSGKAGSEVLSALPQLSRVLNLESEWNTLTSIVQKQIKGSVVAAKSLRILRDLGSKDLTMLRFVIERKAGSFVNTLEALGLAKTFGLRLRQQDYALLQPLSASSLEDIDKLFSPDGKGVSHFDRFERAYKHLRESNRDTRDEREIDTSKLRSVIERVKKVRERKDLAAAQKLLSDLSLQIGNEVFPYLERRLHDSIVHKAKEEFGLAEFDETKLHNPAFISGYTIYRQMKEGKYGTTAPADVENAKAVLSNYLSGVENVLTAHPDNKRWLQRRLSGGRAEKWMSRNEKTYDLKEEPLSSNTAERVRHFSQEAVRLLDELGVEMLDSAAPDELISRFRELRANTLSETQAQVYADLKTQINGLHQTLRGSFGGDRPKKLVIYKETDPVRVLNMGTWVSGSCLDANGINAWSAYVNASEANKGVFWITDENEKILGRVLVAIDKDGKLLRFPMYYAGSGLDLNPYINRYLREFAKELKIGVNGNSKRVEQLVCKKWYTDRETPKI